MMKEKKISRAKAIRLKCLDCCCFQPSEVRKCPSTDCTLHPFRMGRVKRETKEEKQITN